MKTEFDAMTGKAKDPALAVERGEAHAKITDAVLRVAIMSLLVASGLALDRRPALADDPINQDGEPAADTLNNSVADKAPAPNPGAVPSMTTGVQTRDTLFNRLGGSEPACPAGSPQGQPVHFAAKGKFFVPSAGFPALPLPIAVTPGACYSMATVEFDMLVGPFTPHFTCIAALVRPGPRKTHPLYYGFDVQGIKHKATIDMGNWTEIKGTYHWREKQTYHIRLIYDVVQKRMALQITPAGGATHELAGANAKWDLRDDGPGLVLKFGLPGVADGAYFPPPEGWVFSNLSIDMKP